MHAAAVQGDGVFHHRQPNAQAALRPAGELGLGEQVENVRHDFGGDAYARVLHPHHRLVALGSGLDPNPAAVLRVLGRIVDEIDKDLPQPHRIGVEVDWHGWQQLLQPLRSLVD
ncbi:MAG TPA: hypothetical protein VF306_03860 [Pirellulales bacterium]